MLTHDAARDSTRSDAYRRAAPLATPQQADILRADLPSGNSDIEWDQLTEAGAYTQVRATVLLSVGIDAEHGHHHGVPGADAEHAVRIEVTVSTVGLEAPSAHLTSDVTLYHLPDGWAVSNATTTFADRQEPDE